MYIKWTGHGYLMVVLIFAIILTSFYVGNTFTGSVSLLVTAGVMVLLTPLHLLLGWGLNSKRTPAGRLWNERHTCFGLPVQYGFIPQLVFALGIASIALGQLTSPLYGWLLFIGVPVVTLVGFRFWIRAVKRMPAAKQPGTAGTARKRE